MHSKKKILVVEDNMINRMMLCEILSGDYETLEAENGQEALLVLKEHGEEISLILLDIIMPVMDGYTFLSVMKADDAYSSIPVIVTTQSDGEADEIAALAHGASDFVAKPYRPQIIRHRVASIINLRETAAMINLVRYDRLTGLYSKEFFYQQAKETLLRNPDRQYDIICSDIVNFKLVNDVFGIQTGDQLLRDISKLYRQMIEGKGICGRLNSDQFACLLERRWKYTDEMFVDVNEQTNRLLDVRNIAMKWGIYSIEDRDISVEQMCDRALLAAQSIKGQYGKYFAQYNDDLRSLLLKEQEITDSMESALVENQFQVYFQPKYQISDESLFSAEALVRWNHPEWGIQSPGEFIPLFEKNGFITKLDQFVWDRTCAILREWDDKGYPPISVSVNVSRADIYNADLADILMNTVQRYDLQPYRLHLEITESAYTENPKQIIDTVKHLRKLGFLIEMDDFGSGYSSLNMLKEMPIDVLKLDMNFIQNETEKPNNEGILRFIISLARWMRLSVIAEGVETEKQLGKLRELGCNYAQGYYFAKPMPREEFECLIGKQKVTVVEESSITTETASPAIDTVWAFCRAWFELCDAEKASAFLADGVDFVGTGFNELARGKANMTEYIRQDISEIPEPFTCELSVIHEHMLENGTVMLATEMVLKNNLYAWHLRGFLVLAQENGAWSIQSLHFAEPGSSQQKEKAEHYPQTLVMEHIAWQRQQLLNDSLPGGMMGGYIENGFPFYFINRRMLDYLGYTDEAEFVADIDGLVSNCMHPADRTRVDRSVEEQLKNGTEYTVEYRMKKKNGSYIWVHDLGRSTTAEDGRPAIMSVCLDITDQKEAQQQVKDLYERELSYFTELSSADGSLQGTINVTQDRMERYISNTDVAVAKVGDSYSKTIESLAGSAVDAAYGDKIRKTVSREKVLADYAAGKVDYHFEFLRKRNDGGVFWGSTNFRSCLNPETGDVILFFYTSDVTEQKVREHLLGKITELDYEYITELDVIRDTHRVISLHSDEKNMLPYQGSFQKDIRMIASQYIAEDARQAYLDKLEFGYMKQMLDLEDTYSFLAEMRGENGKIRVKRYLVFYIIKELGRVGIARTDVTDVVFQEQRQKEELAAALVAAEQANAAKSDFLSRMSHEIRTPMNAIIGMSTIAAQSIGDDEQVADCISKIGISSRFLLSLINDILDMSRIESGKMLLKNEKIPTEEFLGGINSICYAQANAKSVDYECIADPVLDDYYIGDAMKLQQVLINILSNAIKFTKERGKVTFSATLNKRLKDSAVLRFVVNDTGVGMSEEFLPHIFEPFSQESTGTTALYGGTGLGLAISKNIVDMMGGKITVRSIKGIGSEFSVDIKLGITEEEKFRHNQKKQEFHFSHLKTLVVDDDVAVCESAVVTLKEMGVTAEWVDSGRKAIDRVKSLCKKSKFYDMILIDWKMPDLDGIETARQIRKIVGPDVTIIIMTAYDWIAIEHEAKLAGVNLLMSKPMFKSSLVSAFTKALGQKEEQAQQEKSPEYDFTGKRILLVEDNPINTEVATMLLESKGFAVDTAENGLRAMELYGKSEAGYYDAMLMDIRMPIMDGLTASTNIRHLSNADAKSIPIIAMTANAFDEDIEKSKAAGMNAHLAKPIDPQRLYQTLYDFIFGKEV